MANSETKMKNFVGLSRQYYWVPDAQKSTASSPNPLGPFLHSGSLFSPRVEPLIFDLGASYSTILSLVGVRVAKPHINIRWSDDGSDENERVYRYRLDCRLIVSARGTPQPSEDPLAHFPKKMDFRWVAL